MVIINKLYGFTFKIILLILFLLHTTICSQTLEERITDLILKMTLEEKVLQLHKEGGMNTADNTRLNIPGFIMSDGPHGVRNGLATSFPVGIGLAATWDVDLVYKVGEAMGKEFRGKGIQQMLGPCLDLCLDPRNGRSPETGGEDPYLNAKINTSIVQGVQSTPTIATIKHFYTEYRQDGRTSNNYILSNRMMLEHHGLQFREAIQNGGALSIMNSYNQLQLTGQISGQKAAENPTLLGTILRTKWGFPYYVVSDWGSLWSAENAIKAGCDIEMGSDLYSNESNGLLALVNSGKVTETNINDAVRRVLRTKILSGIMDYYPEGDPSDVNSPAHQALCLEAGKKGIVLLKNQDNILPLDKNKIKTIAVLGPNANEMRTDASGSSWVDPFYKVSPRQGIENYIGTSKVLYAQGCTIAGEYASDFSDALQKAAQAEVVIYFGGLDPTQEGEGSDRANGSIELPGKQKDFIQWVKTANPNVIVVLISGGICTATPFINHIKGLLYAFYPGQEGGNAIAQVLFGDYNPSGKLPVTMPMNDSQLSDRMLNNLDDNKGGGYRWFDYNKYTPQFAFGYGLSYTTFAYSNLKFSQENYIFTDQELTVSVDVKNTGARAGEEVVQLYLSEPVSFVTKFVKDLKGFKKIFLEPGETKTVEFTLGPNEFYIYSEKSRSYEIDPGTYYMKVGGSSDNLSLSKSLDIRPHPPKPDLQVANIMTVPRFPLEGDKVIFLATIVNRGTGPSPKSVFHEVSFSVDGKFVSRSVALQDSISKGGMSLVCGNVGDNNINYWIAGKPGTNTIEAYVDDKNAINEMIETNNKKSVSFKIYNAPPVNLALNKTVTVSSIEGTGLEGSKAVDGNLSTRWSSQPTDQQWITIDFGIPVQFNEIQLIWETAYGKEYLVQTSNTNNNSDWKTIFAQTNGNGGFEKMSSLQGDARYLRILGIKRDTQWGYSLFEIEVFNNITSAVNDKEENLPFNFSLSNNYPNPFNPSTKIEYTLPKSSNVKIEIYNSLGQLVNILENSFRNAGKYNLVWNGNNSSGSPVSSGIYFYRMSAEGFTLVKKMVLVR
ncbi:MAG: glycoside hydrolase family 3 C-terminal domain-containing protein [Ignavibacteriales bacterium]|nr:glycoside hydrolase family 3 C-terminal domain-containing protein [Ignavibacteriales bacterium]